jgi:type 2 lantibiotic biosynthesis protein LanM
MVDLAPMAALLPGLERACRLGRAVPELAGLARCGPFAELALPWLWEARERLRPAEPDRQLAPAALAALEGQLMAELVALAAASWFERFVELRRARGGAADGRARQLYGKFLAQQLAGGWVRHLESHPVLAESAWQRVVRWAAAAEELFARLERDRATLATALGGGRSLGLVVNLEPALSEPHRGGRRVMALGFESGLQLVYKPRPVALEAAFHELLAWLRARGVALPRPLALVDRGAYGWCERVAATPVTSRREARAWFERAGGLLCLARVLAASDLHSENLIAAPDGPFVVDAETLAQPELAPECGVEPLTGLDGELLPPVLASQLLSSAQRDAAGRPYEAGGLLGRGGWLRQSERPTWRDLGTDALGVELAPSWAPEAANRLWLRDNPQDPRSWARELAAGYVAAYQALLRWRSQLLAPALPIARLARARTRLLLRPSRAYGAVLWLLQQPRYQRHPAARERLAEALARPLLERAPSSPLVPLLAEERAQLFAGDVPVLTVAVGSGVLETSAGVPVEGAIAVSGWERVHRNLAELSAEGLRADLAQMARGLAPTEVP